MRGSLINEVVRGSGEIDVLVISGVVGDEHPTPRRPAAKDSVQWARFGWAAFIMAATTALGAVLRSTLSVPDVEMVYLLAIMVTAVRYGRGPSILAAAIAVAAYDFFFVPPVYTFAVADGRYFLTFAMMFVVGLMLSELTARVRRQEVEARQREERTKILYALSRELSAADSRAAAATVVTRHAAEAFEARSFLLLSNSDGTLEQVARFPLGAPLDRKETVVAQWAFEHGRIAGLGTDTLPGSSTACFPLRVGGASLGAIALQPKTGTPLRLEQREFLEAFNRQAAFAFERMKLSDEARSAALRAKAEEMRSSLLSAVSHDLQDALGSHHRSCHHDARRRRNGGRNNSKGATRLNLRRG